MELKPISIKVPVDVLARIDEAAELAKLSRTALLLGPFVSPTKQSTAATAEAITEQAERRGFPTAKKKNSPPPSGDGYQIQVGPTVRKPGDLLKPAPKRPGLV